MIWIITILIIGFLTYVILCTDHPYYEPEENCTFKKKKKKIIPKNKRKKLTEMKKEIGDE